MKKIKKIIGFIPLLFLVGCTTNNVTSSTTSEKPSESIPTISSIEIKKDDVTVNELNILIGDTINLKAVNNANVEKELVWASSDENVATISSDGTLNGVGKGSAIISVKIKDMPYISTSLYVHVKEEVKQIGVGSGASKDDAIFLGNEGEEEPIEIYFLEMSHIYADSVYIKKGNVDILIDTGWEFDGLSVSKFLTEHMVDDRLDVFMLSHSDGDHIDGVANALKDVVDISLMIDYGGQGSGNVKDAREKYTQKGMVYHSAYDCSKGLNGAFQRYYITEELYIDILDTGNYIGPTEISASNPHSLSTLITYKDFTYLTCGDLTSDTESDLISRVDLPEVTLFKASHHGSHGSNSTAFLNKINPKAVAISAARASSFGGTPTWDPNPNNTYNLDAKSGHPAAEAIERIYKAPRISKNLNVYWNAINGTMKFTSFGDDDFTFEGSTPKKGYYDLSLTDGVAIWDDEINDFKNKVTGEENFKLHETKVFGFRDYIKYLPDWAKQEYYPNI